MKILQEIHLIIQQQWYKAQQMMMNKNESRKAWTMEMLTSDGNISTSMMNEPKQMSEEYKKFLYARASHSNHLIQYHMQQIIERQKVVDEYRSMTVEGMGLNPLRIEFAQK